MIEKERYPDDPSFPRRGFRGSPLTSPLNITDRRAVTVIDMKKRRIKSCQLDRAGRRINERKNQVRERCPTCVFFHLRQPEKRPTKEIFGGESVDGGRRVANQKAKVLSLDPCCPMNRADEKAEEQEHINTQRQSLYGHSFPRAVDGDDERSGFV